jgi:polyisoprenoid-binding protein YceI
MKKQLFNLAAFLLLGASGAVAQTTWKVDKSHSNVKFAVSHMVVSEVEGSFRMFDGSLVASKADLSDAKVNFSVDVASVNTDNEKRDGHLKSDDFFNAEKFPKMTFVSKSMKPLGGNKYALTGDLTLRDVTKTVTFYVTYGGQINTGRGVKAGFKAKTTIDRLTYGLKYAPALETGGLAVGKDVEITVLLEMDQAK